MELVTKAAESEKGYAYAKNCFLEMEEKIDTCVGKGKQVEEANRVMPIVKDVAESISAAPSEIEFELDENKIKGLKPKARITYQTSKRPKNALERVATKCRSKAKKKDTVVETLQIFEPNELHFPEVMLCDSSKRTSHLQHFPQVMFGHLSQEYQHDHHVSPALLSYGRGKQPQFNYASVKENTDLESATKDLKTANRIGIRKGSAQYICIADGPQYHKLVGFSNHQKTIPCESGSGSSQIYKRNQAPLPQKSRGGSKSEAEFLFCSRGGILNPAWTSSSKGTAS
ncbi:OLC1v1004441C1 [Oldenlandia corymbosa var. corymbosa]|uniref:OLC1v1004441C1 n=1 Tax=Oldenlandia corymbosa var. corymbosa TaxID=529605 RepID=A0AAV1DES4_OLDCO|nr:OLC1v1004441C1 [Oldenlandia corymbosa var. corymbosa]